MPFVLAAIVFGVVFVGVTWFVVAGGVTALDSSVGASVFDAAGAQPWLPRLGQLLDVLGGGVVSTAVVTAVVVALLLVRPARPAVAAYLVLSALGGAVVNAVVKGLIERSRPPWVGVYALEDSFSYPSGHAMAGITVYVALGAVALVVLRDPWRWPIGLALLAFGPLVGVSRVVLGVHWVTDVLGGWTLGAAWTCAAAAVVIGVAAAPTPARPSPAAD